MMRFTMMCGVSVGCAVVGIFCLGRAPGQNGKPENVVQSGPRSPEEERKGFHLPPGFEIQLVAAEPDIHKPINMNFDDRGRLWVTESTAYPFPVAAGSPHRDAVHILEDTKGNGRADKITTFAEGLNIPIGILPVSQGALVYSIPKIYRLESTNRDDWADQRTVLYGTFGFQDTHGMASSFTSGFDGWVYGCHGFSNTSEVKGSDGKVLKMGSGNTYRFKADGTHIEQWTHGQVNPFGLTFDPLGNLYSCDCETKPIYMLLRGADYPHFGNLPGGLGFAPEMMGYTHGPTAVAGIAYYAAEQFPPPYRDTIFVGNVVSNRINNDRLERHGSTYKALQTPDFLSSDDPWFRPVDIKVGLDGALYVADFYNRIIGHYEVPLTHPGRDHERGRIWRIVYRGLDGKATAVKPRADWSTATVAELIQDLGYPNLVVRLQAANQLVERGGQPAVAAVRALLKDKTTPWQRVHGLWVLERLAALDDQTLETAAHDPDAAVRVHAMHILAERRELSASYYQLLFTGLKDPDAFVQRGAVEALATHPSPNDIRPLLDLRHKVPAEDTHLLHMVRMALCEDFRSPSAWKLLPLTPWTEADGRAVADIAPGVLTAEAAAYLLDSLGKFSESEGNLVRFVTHIARYGPELAGDRVLAFISSDRAGPLKQRRALFKAFQQGLQARGSQLSPAARTWGENLEGQLLASKEESEILAGIELCGTLKSVSGQSRLGAIAKDKVHSESQRAATLSALIAIDSGKSIPVLASVLEDASEAASLRDKAATALASINKAESQAELLKVLPAAPERLAVTIAVGLARSRPGGEKLLETVAAAKASPRLLQDPGVHAALNAANLNNLKDRVAKLTAGLIPADQRLQDLLDKRRHAFPGAKADPLSGLKIFEKNCALCHQLAGKGARIGPQLDGIGLRGPDRLVEDILDPSRNVDQAFRLTFLTLKNGQILSGLVLREEGEVVVVADSQGKEIRVARKDIDERVVSPLSLMPGNLGQQISEADFNNLLAFLLMQRPKGS